MYRNDPLEHFRTASVTLVKQDGERIEGLKAIADSKKKVIKILAADAVVADGDTILQHLSNGVTEEYLVLDSGYEEQYDPFPPEYQAKVEKKTAIKRLASPSGPVYNVTFTGANSRFNLNSNDLSVNVVDVNPDELFKALRGAIAQDVEDEDKRELLLRQVGELKKANGTPKYLEAYKEFVSTVADHLGVVMPFMTALSQLL
jgi:hypothetical protein